MRSHRLIDQCLVVCRRADSSVGFSYSAAVTVLDSIGNCIRRFNKSACIVHIPCCTCCYRSLCRTCRCDSIFRHGAVVERCRSCGLIACVILFAACYRYICICRCGYSRICGAAAICPAASCVCNSSDGYACDCRCCYTSFYFSVIIYSYASGCALIIIVIKSCGDGLFVNCIKRNIICRHFQACKGGCRILICVPTDECPAALCCRRS